MAKYMAVMMPEKEINKAGMDRFIPKRYTNKGPKPTVRYLESDVIILSSCDNTSEEENKNNEIDEEENTHDKNTEVSLLDEIESSKKTASTNDSLATGNRSASSKDSLATVKLTASAKDSLATVKRTASPKDSLAARFNKESQIQNDENVNEEKGQETTQQDDNSAPQLRASQSVGHVKNNIQVSINIDDNVHDDIHHETAHPDDYVDNPLRENDNVGLSAKKKKIIQKWDWSGTIDPSDLEIRKLIAYTFIIGVRSVFTNHMYRIGDKFYLQGDTGPIAHCCRSTI